VLRSAGPEPLCDICICIIIGHKILVRLIYFDSVDIPFGSSGD
jgi:hypothetical protein